MKHELWNDAARRGALLGVVMSASHIFEQMFILGGSPGRISAVGLEMIAVAILYVWLLWRFSKRAAERFGDDTLGFGYGRALLYVVCTAALTGIIVGLSGYLYIHYGVGYDNYVDRVAEMYRTLTAGSPLPAALRGTYDGMLAEMRLQPEPSVVSTVVSSLFSYVMTGTAVGLFIAAGVKREPRIFGNEPNGKEDDDE